MPEDAARLSGKEGGRFGRAIGAFGTFLLFALSLVMSVVVAEGFFALLLTRPSLLRYLPRNTASHVRRLYLEYDRNVIQSMSCCARYDKQLFYTLRPGKFYFGNREFSNAFLVNHLGVRDTEEALKGPSVVVLGDSYAMGWGVDQDQTIAKTIERATGLRSLNAGISGYGTVRELRLLDRIDTSAMRYLVIEYCDDDVLETRPFATRGKFKVGNEQRYEADVERARKRKHYYFPRRTLDFLAGIFKPEPVGFLPATPAEAAEYFANALVKAGNTDLSHVQIITFEISQSRTVSGAFAFALRTEVTKLAYPPYVRNLQVLGLEGRLKPEHYYTLDDHLRPEGQLAVANAVIQTIQEDEAKR